MTGVAKDRFLNWPMQTYSNFGLLTSAWALLQQCVVATGNGGDDLVGVDNEGRRQQA